MARWNAMIMLGGAASLAALGGLAAVRPMSPAVADHRAADAELLRHGPGGAACRALPVARAGEPPALAAARSRCEDADGAYGLAVRNLIQQERAADAAAAQAALAHQANLIAFAELAGGLATLAAAIAAAVFARQAAVAAADALGHSRDVAALELRPYLDFAGVRIRRTAGRAEVVVNIENFGRVPATVTAMETGYRLVGKAGRFALPGLRDARFDPRSVAPGGSIESVHRSLLSLRNLGTVEREEGRVVFHCGITYTDFARTFEDVLERAWIVRREHLDGERTLMRVHRGRHVLEDGE